MLHGMDGQRLAPKLMDFHTNCESNHIRKLKEFWGIETSSKFQKVKIYSDDERIQDVIRLVSEEEEEVTDDEVHDNEF